MRFLTITFAFSWLVWGGAWLLSDQPSAMNASAMRPAIYIGSFGPSFAALTVMLTRGRDSLRDWVSSYLRWRIGWRALAALSLAMPLSVLGITLLLGYSPNVTVERDDPAVLFYLTIFPVCLANGLVTALVGAGPLGEEGGWRGFLLPALMPRFGELRASIAIGVIWSVWHLPLMLAFPDWRDGNSLAFYFPVYTIGLVGLSLLLTRIWLLARGSLVACIWLHGIINALGAVAFNHKIWTSDYSQPQSTAHFALAIWIAVAITWALGRRSASNLT